jgi:hypothetical protein
MAKDFLHANSVSHNTNLLTKIAKVHLAIREMNQEGHKHWPEDDGPLLQCLGYLEEAAQRLELETAEDCLAILAITENFVFDEASAGCLDKLERKARLAAIDITRNN